MCDLCDLQVVLNGANLEVLPGQAVFIQGEGVDICVMGDAPK